MFFSVNESTYRDQILHRLYHRNGFDIVISAVLFFNLTTLLSLSLAANGLDVHTFGWYFFCSFLLLLTSAAIENYGHKISHAVSVSTIIEAMAIASIFVINAKAITPVEPPTLLLIVNIIVLISLPISIRSFFQMALGKGLIAFCSISYALLYGSEENKFTYLVFPNLVVFVLMLVICYWLYIKHTALLHQQFELKALKNLLDQKNTSLHQTNERLQKEHDLRDKMIRHIGHDLRQPINTINYSLFNIRKYSLKEKHLVQLDIAQKSIDTANVMIEDILQIASYEKKDISVENEVFTLQQVFNLLNKEYSSICQLQGIELSIIPCSLSLDTDKQLFTRILRNYLSNAIKHSHSNKIVLGARRGKSTVEIQVIDRGQGITEEKQALLFEEIHSVDPNDNTRHFSLGLSIVRHLANQMKAHARIDSSPGQGTLCALKITYLKAEQ